MGCQLQQQMTESYIDYLKKYESDSSAKKHLPFDDSSSSSTPPKAARSTRNDPVALGLLRRMNPLHNTRPGNITPILRKSTRIKRAPKYLEDYDTDTDWDHFDSPDYIPVKQVVQKKKNPEPQPVPLAIPVVPMPQPPAQLIKVLQQPPAAQEARPSRIRKLPERFRNY